MTKPNNSFSAKDAEALQSLHDLQCLIDSAVPDPEVLSTIRQRLDDHERWLDSNGANGKQLKATKENFTGVDFSHRKLGGAVFNGCTFDYANLRSVEMHRETSFWNCTFSNALLITMRLSDTKFMNCAFTQCKFQGTVFENVWLTGTANRDLAPEATTNDFSFCTFTNTDFTTFHLYGAVFKDAKLSGVRFRDCPLPSVDFRETQILSSLDFYLCRMGHTNFSNMMIEGSQFADCELAGAKFIGALAKGCNFSRATLTLAEFDNADLKGAVFNNVGAHKVSFPKADLTKCEARLGHFREADFLGAKLPEGDFSGSDLLGAKLDETTNQNLTNFSGCTWIDGSRCRAGSIGGCDR